MLTIEVTFLKDLIADIPLLGYVALGLSWVLFLLALIFGIWGLLSITGTIGQGDPIEPSSIYDKNVKIPAILQVLSFGSAMLLTVVFGVILLWIQAVETSGFVP